MKVTPFEQKGISKNKMENRSKADQYFVYGIHMLAWFFGLIPFKINTETGELSFRWISCETFWSLIRLVVINVPFSILPILLFLCFGTQEWEPEEMSHRGNMTTRTSNMTGNMTSGNITGEQMSTPTIFFGVFGIELISSYFYFVLFRAAKKWMSDFHDNFYRRVTRYNGPDMRSVTLDKFRDKNFSFSVSWFSFLCSRQEHEFLSFNLGFETRTRIETKINLARMFQNTFFACFWTEVFT